MKEDDYKVDGREAYVSVNESGEYNIRDRHTYIGKAYCADSCFVFLLGLRVKFGWMNTEGDIRKKIEKMQPWSEPTSFG